MQSRCVAITFTAFLSAVIAPTLPFIATGGVYFLTLAISAAHALILGVPMFFFVKRFIGINFWSTSITGFLVALIPIAIWSWPLSYASSNMSSSHWNGDHMVQTMINGVPTIDGWLSYAKSAALFGLFGLVSGVVFWVVWRLAGPKKIRTPN